MPSPPSQPTPPPPDMDETIRKESFAACQSAHESSPESKPTAPSSVAAPETMPPPPPDGLWRDGQNLVLWRGVRLPRRCAVCGAPAHGKMRGVSLRIESRIPTDHAVTLAVAITADSTRIRYGYCRAHAPWMGPIAAQVLGVASGLAAVGLGMGAYAIFNAGGMPLTGSVLAVLGAMCVWFFFASVHCEPLFELIQLDDRHARISGFGEGFLSGLPDHATALAHAREAEAANLEQIVNDSDNPPPDNADA